MNDGGDSLVVYVLDQTCGVVGEIGAPLDPFDVEDLARGPDGRLWLSDTGDNDGQRDTVAIEILGEDGSAELYRLSYPDGAHDAEALLVDASGTPYVVTKSVIGRSGVYAPAGPLTEVATPDVPAPMSKVAEVDLDLTGTAGGPVGSVGQLLVTGGAVSPDGRLIALRTYTDAYVWAVPEGASIPSVLQDVEPRVVPLPPAPQGEAIAFGANGRDLVLSSEGSPFAVVVVPAVPDPPPSTSAAAPSGPSGRTDGGGPDGSNVAAAPVGDTDQSVALVVVVTAATVGGLTAVCWSALRPVPGRRRRS